ncbi:MAG: hypothetical protein L3K15_05005 [Thermoplasmata archaeon]|nr:hypothetical protein [Thermoplasmata archaeon]
MAEPSGKPASTVVEPNVYFALGVVGAVVFLIGVFKPLLGRLPYSGYLGIVIAAAGGAVAVFGFGRWVDARKPPAHPALASPEERDRIRYSSSFEVYDPRAPEKPSRPVGRRPRDRPPR